MATIALIARILWLLLALLVAAAELVEHGAELYHFLAPRASATSEVTRR